MREIEISISIWPAFARGCSRFPIMMYVYLVAVYFQLSCARLLRIRDLSCLYISRMYMTAQLGFQEKRKLDNCIIEKGFELSIHRR